MNIKVKKNKYSLWSILGILFIFLLVTLFCIVLTLLGVIWVMEKGPSPAATARFCQSVRETSAIRWVSGIFLSEAELEQYKSTSTGDLHTEDVDRSLISIASSSEMMSEKTEPVIKTDMEEAEDIELVDISDGSIKGKLLIVKDPKRVTLGISGTFGSESGKQLSEIVKDYGAIAGINAGGFNDEGGQGDGGTPQGLVIYNGELIWGSKSVSYNVIGLDKDGILQIGTMTGDEALQKGITSAVSFITHDGLSSSLIINGVVQSTNFGKGVNPRTAIGQRADGALLLLVLDGRSIRTLGATIDDVCSVMLRYGAINVGNLDGGSSSVMVYDGKIINNCASVTGPRRIPTAFVVTGENNEAY